MRSLHEVHQIHAYYKCNFPLIYFYLRKYIKDVDEFRYQEICMSSSWAKLISVRIAQVWALLYVMLYS
jgi:hypothetical protein